MPNPGRTPLCCLLLVLASLGGSSFAGDEFRVFQVRNSLAQEIDDPAIGPDYYVNGGTDDGLRVGQHLEVYRDQVATDPVTGDEHAMRLPVGEVVLISVDATAAVSRRTQLVLRGRAPLLGHPAVMVGDVAVPRVEPVAETPAMQPTDNVAATPVRIGLVVELPSSILFDLDSAILKSDKADFSGVEQALAQYPEHHLIVEGHTCDLGTDAHNARLSFARARSVAAHLGQRFGVREDRMTIVGYGPARPAASNPNGRDRNRRVEIRFVTQPENVVRASNSAAP